jgi:hypothetical protein
MSKSNGKSPPVKISSLTEKPDYQGALAILRGQDPDKIIRTVPLNELEAHELALIFPPYTEDDLAKLACDIRDRGIILYQQKVLDGWNRVAACKKTGMVIVPFLLFEGDEGQAQAFVYAKNMLRRQLTDDQRAGIAARFATMGHGGDRKSGPGIKPPIGGLTAEAAASQAGVSKRTVERAKAVDREDPALIDEVIAGKKKLAAATKEAGAKKSEPVASKPSSPPKQDDDDLGRAVFNLESLCRKYGHDGLEEVVKL